MHEFLIEAEQQISIRKLGYHAGVVHSNVKGKLQSLNTLNSEISPEFRQ